MQTIQQTLAADERTGMITRGREWTRTELNRAFRDVQDATNWKNPINALIDEDLMDITDAAVVFFAGCRPTFSRESTGLVRVTAIGYFAAVGA